MVKQGIVIGVVVVCVLAWWSERAWAAAAGGAITDRQVFTLTAAGAAKVANAEKSITQAVRILGLLGRVGGYVGGALLLYDVVSNTWDWWNQTYPTDLAGNNVTDTRGSWGTTQAGGAVFGPARVYFGDAGVVCGAVNGGTTIVGMSVTYYSNNPTCNGVQFKYTVDFYYVYNSGVNAPSPLNGAVSQPGGVDRNTLIAAIDGALADQALAQSKQSGYWSSNASVWQGTFSEALTAARSYLSSGVGLSSGTDYTQGSGWANGNPALSGNAKPETVAPGAGSGESGSVDLSPVTSAISASQAAITSALSAVQSGVVSAVDAVASQVVAASSAITSAISASQAAVVSAVAAAQSAITSAVSAVESAVASIPAAINSGVGTLGGKLDEVKSAVQAINPGGGAAGVVEKLEAQDQAAVQAGTASAAPTFACPTCSRTEGWSALFESWRAAAMGAPIFALVGRLAWPGVGMVQREWLLGSWMGHSMGFNMNDSGIGTVITAVRFVVIGGAVIAAYFVIFG